MQKQNKQYALATICIGVGQGYAACFRGHKFKLTRFENITIPAREKLSIISYHMADYFNHWLQFGRGLPNPPRIFGVNWFRKDKDGNFLWPGFKDNMRVLKWIVGRASGNTSAIESPIGWMPRYKDIDWNGLDFSKSQFREIMEVDREAWKKELLGHEELFARMYDKLPKEFIFMRGLLLSALWRSPEHWGLQPEVI